MCPLDAAWGLGLAVLALSATTPTRGSPTRRPRSGRPPATPRPATIDVPEAPPVRPVPVVGGSRASGGERPRRRRRCPSLRRTWPRRRTAATAASAPVSAVTEREPDGRAHARPRAPLGRLRAAPRPARDDGDGPAVAAVRMACASAASGSGPVMIGPDGRPLPMNVADGLRDAAAAPTVGGGVCRVTSSSAGRCRSRADPDRRHPGRVRLPERGPARPGDGRCRCPGGRRRRPRRPGSPRGPGSGRPVGHAVELLGRHAQQCSPGGRPAHPHTPVRPRRPRLPLSPGAASVAAAETHAAVSYQQQAQQSVNELPTSMVYGR